MTEEHPEHTDTDASSDDAPESKGTQFTLPEPLRSAAILMMDTADDVADWIEEGIGRIWSTPPDPDDMEEAEVTEVREEETAD